MTATVLLVAPYEVEPGDRLVGLRTPVAKLDTDGVNWFYWSADDRLIARRHVAWKVQIVRGEVDGSPLLSLPDGSGPEEVGAEFVPRTDSPGRDDCPARGIQRVRGGLFVVTP